MMCPIPLWSIFFFNWGNLLRSYPKLLISGDCMNPDSIQMPCRYSLTTITYGATIHRLRLSLEIEVQRTLSNPLFSVCSHQNWWKVSSLSESNNSFLNLHFSPFSIKTGTELIEVDSNRWILYFQLISMKETFLFTTPVPIVWNVWLKHVKTVWFTEAPIWAEMSVKKLWSKPLEYTGSAVMEVREALHGRGGIAGSSAVCKLTPPSCWGANKCTSF